MRRLVTVAALGALALVPSFAQAGEGDGKADTHVAFVAITMIGDDRSYEGTIDSRKRCADGRRVIVFRARPGKNEKIGSTRANGAVGAWSVLDSEKANGTYYAKAPETPECEGDKSGKLSIGEIR